jgi:hypothetical protein
MDILESGPRTFNIIVFEYIVMNLEKNEKMHNFEKMKNKKMVGIFEDG